MADKKTYTIRAEIKDCEIRKVEDVANTFTKDGKEIEYHKIVLACDVGEDCDRIYLTDKDMSNLAKYKRGMVGTFKIRIDVEEDFGTKAKILVTDFIEQ